MAADGYSFYVRRQPETADEIEAVRRAINECPVEAIFDRLDARRPGPRPRS
jgi:hypothetical protein